ncbi:MAG: HAMP domain-containing histidine kinase [Clostridiales bacterium]|nr:HAMP domain-containing histidine kinase [Clostridiales bacterium]
MNRETNTSEARKQVMRLLFRGMIWYVAIDAILLLCFQGPAWAFVLIAAVELAALVTGVEYDNWMVQQAARPLEAISETADVLAKAELTASDLQQLARRLDDINVESLSSRIRPPVSQAASLTALTAAINGMLERLDTAYQAEARFVSDASHELRTPIAVIQGYADLLDRWGKDDPAVRQEAVDAIRKEAENMSNLVQQLLFLARGDNETQVVEPERFCLSDLAEDIFRETALLEPGQTLESDLAPQVYVLADVGLIRQAVRILVDNACKYTPQSGSVTLSLTAREGYALLTVADTGPGIPPEEQERVFERFYRSEQSRSRATGGTGLGLPIARWIARRHGGDILLGSVPGQGSRFTLVLPLPEAGT